MVKLKQIFGLTLIASICFMSVGCAPKARKAGGYMDDPPTHYKQGMKYYNDEKFDKATEEFNLALSLDAKYAPAYAGLALTNAQKGDFKEAMKLADKALSLDNKLVDAYIARAMVITKQNEGKPAKEWLKDVENEYEKALKIDPLNSEVYYRRGVCYKKAYDFSKAAADFSKVLELKKEWTLQADEQWQIVQMIQRAAPGTDVGKKIALVEKITRADIAALFVSELDVARLVEKKRPKNYDTDGFKAPADNRQMVVDSMKKMAVVTDLDNHWAKNFIMDIVDLKIRGLEPYPDHTFHPAESVNRAEYALIVEDVIIAVLRDPSLATKHIGSQSRCPDVSSSHPAYNAICNAIDKGVMDANLNGEFGPEKPVSGPEALLVIRKIKELQK